MTKHKGVTLDKLADMMEAGFEHILNEVSGVKTEVDEMKKDVKVIKGHIVDIVPKVKDLGHRVDYIENTLSIKK